MSMSSEHQDLVKVIRGVHHKLRKAFHISGDPDKVWAEHLADESLRKEYSLAMLKLATKVWKGKECRIEWCHKVCLNYFYGGGLQRSLSREMKLEIIAKSKQTENKISFADDSMPIMHLNNYCNLNRKLRLLDVGSCYNPFSKYEDYSCVAVDLTPATEDVLQCDFLTLNIKPKDENHPFAQALPFYEDTFDIVVFSMVLEYLPASKQRALFFYKAWQLLMDNGLCVIITPDSKSAHHNAHMMKSWQLALERMGFLRVKYDKLQHLHCMAFRKLKKCKCSDWSDSSITELLYIPQDFTQYFDEEAVVARSEKENFDLCKFFSELPNEDSF